MSIRLLGPVTLLVDGHPQPVGGPGARSVLALLALHANQVVSQNTIIDTMWTYDPPPTARTIVHGHISALRRRLATAQRAAGEQPVAHIHTVAPGYRLEVDERRIDAHRARALLDASAGVPLVRRIELLDEALGLWHGPVLGDAAGHVAVAELEELRRAVHGAKIDAELELGRHAEVIAELGSLVRDNPHSERFTGQLMRALYHSGRRAEALDAYHEFASKLIADLGIEPGPGLRELHANMLQDDLGTDGSDQGQLLRLTPMQLPPAVPFLAGRSPELAWLDDLAERAVAGRNIAAVLSGTAGIGKTALAVWWAHHAASRFDDGVLYASLHGFDPHRPPREPAEVLTQLLRGLGVRPGELPEDFAERVGLYRSLLAGRRMLVVLDDARSAEQVESLLPPAAGAMALVTSRARMDDLAVARAARQLTLGTLAERDAVSLITELSEGSAAADAPLPVPTGTPVGTGSGDGAGSAAELRDYAETLAELCGYLPLALRIVGARLSARPPGAARQLVASLRDERTRLGALELDAHPDGEAPIGVRAALDVSVAELGTVERETLRVLGVFPGRTVRPHLVAALCQVDVEQARKRMRVLASRNLFTEHAPDEFAAHDLVRAFLGERARRLDVEDEQAILRRAWQYYIAVADRARRALSAVVDGLDHRDLVPAELLPEVSGFGGALDWFAAEWQNLFAMLRRCHEAGWYDEAWRLARMAHPYRINRPSWDDWIELAHLGLDAARRSGDRHALFWMLISRCAARLVFERMDNVLADADGALEVAAELGDPALRVTALTHRGCALTSLERHPEAFAVQLDALAEAEPLGDEMLRSQVMHNYAEARKRAGQYSEAIELQSEVFEVYTQRGHHGDVIRSLANLAEMWLYAGEFDEAERAARKTIRLAAAREVIQQEGVGRLILGRVLRARGDRERARAELRAAVELHEEIGDPHANALRQELEGL
ncbi:tetratricopeptide repeat protein [Haloechinothrix sp. LS1_15]|nr:tetratricopeptide repeat protein [Haloechinothrix sp. LS1_15]